MEGKGLKSVIMCVLTLGLIVEQIQVQGRITCRSAGSEWCFGTCTIETYEIYLECAKSCGCEVDFNHVPNTEHIQVEGSRTCDSMQDSICFAQCGLNPSNTREDCEKFCGCKVPNAEATIVSDYCKLGCASSVCDAISTNVGNEKQKDAVERCNNACSRLCTKDVKIAMVNA